MNAAEIIQQCRQAGVVLQARGDRLHVEAPRGVLTDERRRLLAEHKADLLAVLADDNAREYFDERAAIREYEGGLDRDSTERQAARNIIEYRLPDAGWLVLLAAPGETYAQAVESLQRRYGDRLLEARQYRRHVLPESEGVE